eukprot:gene12332-16541_t
MHLIVLITQIIANFPYLIQSKRNRESTAITSFRPGGQYIALTFSNGPHAKITSQILQILSNKNINATFFLQGIKVLNQPDLVKRIHLFGHSIGISGWDNTPFTTLTKQQIIGHISHTRDLVTNITNYQDDYYLIRPPYGKTNDDINEILNAHSINNTIKHAIKNNKILSQSTLKQIKKYRVILWNIDSKDLASSSNNASVISSVVTPAKPGDIILCHDMSGSLLQALPAIIDQLTEKGFEFLTIPQLLEFPDDSPH